MREGWSTLRVPSEDLMLNGKGASAVRGELGERGERGMMTPPPVLWLGAPMLALIVLRRLGVRMRREPWIELWVSNNNDTHY